MTRLSATLSAVRCRIGFELRRAHADERGTISMMTLVILFIFTILLGMIMNVGREVDDKIRLQNAADAGTYSAGVVLARGMNALAFTNHLEAELFAMTAYFREGRDRNAEKFVPEILAAWSKIAPMFNRATGIPEFQALGPAISAKVPLEQEVVLRFSELTAKKSQIMLPALESILGQPGQNGDPQSHLIPVFQRAVVQATPIAAQLTMNEIASRHCAAQRGARSRPLGGVLWRTRVMAAGEQYEDDPLQRTIPAIDPASNSPDARRLGGGSSLNAYQTLAIGGRRELAQHYLESWISDPMYDLGPFEREGGYSFDGSQYTLDPMNGGGRISAKMSQFIGLWRIFTCGQLNELLNFEYPTTNLPHMVRFSSGGQLPGQMTPGSQDLQQLIETDYSFVGVVYWPQLAQTFPKYFKNRIGGDSMAFTQINIVVPARRYRYPWKLPRASGSSYSFSGGRVTMNAIYDVDHVDGWPARGDFLHDTPSSEPWDLFNQNWLVQVTPATNNQLPAILQTQPPSSLVPGASLPNLQGLTQRDLFLINSH